MDTTNVKVEFIILGNGFSPDDISDKLSIEPSLKWKRGDKINPEKHERIYKCSGWEISTEYEESFDINEQLDKILKKIENYGGVLAKLCEKDGIESRFCIVIKIEKGQTPAMVLSRKLIEFAYAINAEIEFDVYANPYSEID